MKQKLLVEFEMEFDLDSFKKWFNEQLPEKKKVQTWKDVLEEIIDDSLETLDENLFSYIGNKEFDFGWKINKIEVLNDG